MSATRFETTCTGLGVQEQTEPTNGAHPWSERWCALLDRILAGRGAEALDRSRLSGSTAVVVLPSFVWIDPRVDLGRKGRGRDGAHLRFPARVVWPDGAVVLVPAGESVVLKWEASGVGVVASGTTEVVAGTAERAGDAGTALGLGLVPVSMDASSMPRRRALSELDRLVEDGTLACWEARQVLERHAEWMLRHRHAAVAAEINPETTTRLFDETDLEVVRAELLLGNPERRISPAYDRIIERCLAPGAFARVDPMRRVMTSLRSVAETALRRRLEDPHVGRKVRRLLREETFADLDELLSRYRELWPRDAIGVRRVAAALEVIGTAAPIISSLAGVGSAMNQGDGSSC